MTCTRMFTAQPSIYQQLNGKTKCSIYSYNRILLSNTKEGTTDTCNNKDLKQKCLAKKRGW